MRQAEARMPEPAVPEPVELRQPPAGGAGTVPGSVPAADRYCRTVPASAGSASGSSPHPVLVAKEPAEGVLAAKAPADWVPAEEEPADSSPDSAVAAAVATPAA